MPRTKLSLDERIRQLQYELLELEEEYKTQLYFETMPAYDPTYEYCYATSNMSIRFEHQHLDHWLRAVKKHMATRLTGHGGAVSSAVIVSVPIGLSASGVEEWLSYVTTKLRKQAKRYQKK